MLDKMCVNDEQLTDSDIRQLENADEIAHFFAKLRYDVNGRTNIPDFAVLSLGSEDLHQQIRKIELIGKDPVDYDISIYLFEVRSVTAKLRNDIARRFRERSEIALLVLTQNYEDLEFVLLDLVLSKSQSRRAALKQAIRPIPLPVSRLHPKAGECRALKRFTFPEEDSDYQWEKLRSAYMLAEWSEEYFNNRALFSDYYLKQRLTDSNITPEWDEDVRPIGCEIYTHLITARKAYTRQPEEVIRKGLYELVFTLLGFDFARQKSDASGAATADYLLYAPKDRAKPIAAALTYVWNRNLDDVDESRERTAEEGGTPFEIPGARVVSLLEAQVAPWVIVTNGKLWRLYSSTASNKATNYFEIDLEEAVAANDQIIALKYWWLMFRQQAFTGFLDKLLQDSAAYAKELGARLKDRVFEEIFTQFARGFIADMRAKGISDLNDETLATVYSGTMTFLYRLMFILYAESLELLPLHDVRGYGDRSLDRMKQEIAEVGGTLRDTAPERLSQQYRVDSTALYDRLQALFRVIDQGSDELNMPTYDGGLFTPETAAGQFLTSYAIPDRYHTMQIIACSPDTPRFPPPYHEVDVFEIQDNVIESIMGDVEQQEATVIVNSPVAEEQALVAQVLQRHLNHPEVDRQELRELRRFLRQPLVGASVQQLRKALQTYSSTSDVQVLIEAVRALYQHQGAAFSDEPGDNRPATRIARQDLKLICYEYIHA